MTSFNPRNNAFKRSVPVLSALNMNPQYSNASLSSTSCSCCSTSASGDGVLDGAPSFALPGGVGMALSSRCFLPDGLAVSRT